jgi:hypothetical protein
MMYLLRGRFPVKGGPHFNVNPLLPTSMTFKSKGGSGTSSTRTLLFSFAIPKAFLASQTNAPESVLVVVLRVNSETSPSGISLLETVYLLYVLRQERQIETRDSETIVEKRDSKRWTDSSTVLDKKKNNSKMQLQ